MTQPPIADGFDFPVGKPNHVGYKLDNPFLDTGLRSKPHLGEDWNGVGGGNSDLDDPIFAIAHGMIVHAAHLSGGWGGVVIIEHHLPDGRRVESMYGHLASIKVQMGARVMKGNQIGTMGNSDGQYFAHLHFEMRTPDCKSYHQAGPGYSHDHQGWIHPSNFINQHRDLTKLLARVTKAEAFPILTAGGPPQYWQIELQNESTMDWRSDNQQGELMVLALGKYTEPNSQRHAELGFGWPKPDRLAIVEQPLVKIGERGTFRVGLQASAEIKPGFYVIKFTPKNPKGYFNDANDQPLNCFITVQVVAAIEQGSAQSNPPSTETRRKEQNIALFQSIIVHNAPINQATQPCLLKAKPPSIPQQANATTATPNTARQAKGANDPDIHVETDVEANEVSLSSRSTMPSVFEEDLVVFDAEPSGDRHFEPINGRLDIVQTDIHDIVIVHAKHQTLGDTVILDSSFGQQSLPVETLSTGQQIKLPISYQADRPLSKLDNILNYWLPPTFYRLQLPNKTISIKAFNPDLCLLSINMPQLKAIKNGIKYARKIIAKRNAPAPTNPQNKRAVHQTRASDEHQGQTITSQQLFDKYNQKVAKLITSELYVKQQLLIKDQSTLDPNSPILYKINGLPQHNSIINQISQIYQLYKALYSSLLEIIKGTPKVGMFFEFDCQILQGALNIFWGWQESPHHHCFYNFGVALDIELIKINASLGIGMKIKDVDLQLFLEINGSLFINTSISIESQQLADITLTRFNAIFGVAAGIRCKATDQVNIEGAVSTALSVNGAAKIKAEEGFIIEGQTSWQGVTLTVSVQVLGFELVDIQHQLAEEKILNSFAIPKQYDRETPLGKSAIEAIITQQLQDGSCVFIEELADSFWKPELLQTKNAIDLSIVSNLISEAIHKYQTQLDLSEKSIQGLVQVILKDCESFENAKSVNISKHYVEIKILKDYLDDPAGEFYRHILAASDPMAMLSQSS